MHTLSSCLPYEEAAPVLCECSPIVYAPLIKRAMTLVVPKRLLLEKCVQMRIKVIQYMVCQHVLVGNTRMHLFKITILLPSVANVSVMWHT